MYVLLFLREINNIFYCNCGYLNLMLIIQNFEYAIEHKSGKMIISILPITYLRMRMVFQVPATDQPLTGVGLCSAHCAMSASVSH